MRWCGQSIQEGLISYWIKSQSWHRPSLATLVLQPLLDACSEGKLTTSQGSPRYFEAIMVRKQFHSLEPYLFPLISMLWLLFGLLDQKCKWVLAVLHKEAIEILYLVIHWICNGKPAMCRYTEPQRGEGRIQTSCLGSWFRGAATGQDREQRRRSRFVWGRRWAWFGMCCFAAQSRPGGDGRYALDVRVRSSGGGSELRVQIWEWSRT